MADPLVEIHDATTASGRPVWADMPCATLFKDWAAYPLTATSDYQVAGGHPAPDRRPWVNGRWRDYVSLAGSETSPSDPGYLAGAVEVGKRAVAETMDPSLQPPRVPGHEVVGRIIAIGENVPSIWKLGQRVGVGRLGAGKAPLPVSAGYLVVGERSVQGSITGTPYENEKALNFSALTDVHPQIETMPLEKALDAYQKMKSGDVKFRMVLTMKDSRHAH